MFILILKKIGYGIIAAATVWLLFFYSNEKPSVDDGKLHIQYWLATGQKDVIPYAVTKYNSMQDSIVIDMVIIPWQEHEKKILTAILSGNPPDIISQFNPVAQWASRLALIPIDEFIHQDKFDTTVFFPVRSPG